jgi:hypothetical protein
VLASVEGQKQHPSVMGSRAEVSAVLGSTGESLVTNEISS